MILLRHQSPFALTLLLPALLLAACELKDSCDPDQHLEYGLCVDPPVEETGGAPGDDECSGMGMGGQPNISEENIGDPCDDGEDEDDACGYVGEDCRGGTICGGSRLPECIGLCGPGDAFEGACPDGLTCTDLGEASLCF